MRKRRVVAFALAAVMVLNSVSAVYAATEQETEINISLPEEDMGDLSDTLGELEESDISEELMDRSQILSEIADSSDDENVEYPVTNPTENGKKNQDTLSQEFDFVLNSADSRAGENQKEAEYSEEFTDFASQFLDEEANIYETMSGMIDTTELTWSKETTYESLTVENFETEAQSISVTWKEQLQHAYDAYSYDHTENFWLDEFQVQITVEGENLEDGGMKVTSYVTGQPVSSHDNETIHSMAAEVDTEVDIALASGTTAEELVAYLLDTVDLVEADGLGHGANPYGALVEKRASQEGMARTLNMLLHRQGTPAALAAGVVSVEGEDGAEAVHGVWNYVEEDGSWIVVDMKNHGLASEYHPFAKLSSDGKEFYYPVGKVKKTSDLLLENLDADLEESLEDMEELPFEETVNMWRLMAPEDAELYASSEHSKILPTITTMKTSAKLGNKLLMRYILYHFGNVTDKYYVAIYKGSTSGKLVASKTGNFTGSVGRQSYELNWNTANAETGTYVVRVFTSYQNSSGEQKLDSSSVYSFNIYVKDSETPLTALDINIDSLNMEVGTENKSVWVMYNPEDTSSDRKVSWTSSNDLVASVVPDTIDYGYTTITALSAGQTNITVATGGGTSKTIQLNVYDKTKIYEYVTRLYENILGRHPDASGLAQWSERFLTGATTGATSAYHFTTGTEYIAKNVSNSKYIDTMYQTLLNRKVDVTGKATWLEYLENGVSRAFVFKSLVDSTEFANLCADYGIQKGTIELTENRDKNYSLTTYVNRCYQSILGRSADVSGLNKWSGVVLAGKGNGGVNVVAGLMESREFMNRGKSDGDIVEILYQAMLGRKADASGKEYWSKKLQNGMSVTYVVRGISNSSEFKKMCYKYSIETGTIILTENRDKNEKVTEFVARCYTKALNRAGEVTGINQWTGQIITKAQTPAQVVKSFVLSDEAVQKNTDNLQFINMMYRACMGREADVSGRNVWMSRMAAGMTRGTVADRFVNSTEFKKIVAGYGI